MPFDLSFLTTGITPWLALVGVILGLIFVYKAKKKDKTLLYPMLGFGMITLVATGATIPFIGSWIAIIMGWIVALSLGIFLPIAAFWAIMEMKKDMKKAFG